MILTVNGIFVPTGRQVVFAQERGRMFVYGVKSVQVALARR